MSNSIFITGAGAGIGRATALLFAAKGWRVGAADYDEAALESLRASLGEGCATFRLDVRDEEAVRQALADFTATTGGQLRVLHNNAGILTVGHFEEIALADHRRIVEINVIGALTVLHAAFPYLKATPDAHVINMSSGSAFYGTPDFASYSASKHAIRALTEALDIEWRRHGIRISDIMPSVVNTEMVRTNKRHTRIFDQMGGYLSPEQVAEEVWRLVHKPALHRPLPLTYRALWLLGSGASGRLTRAVMARMWRG